MEYFCCYNSYLKSCKGLSDAEIGRLFRALMEYNVTGTTPETSGREAIAFDFIVANIDREREAYAEKCRSNSRNGKAGAEARWQTPKENSGRYNRHFVNSENGKEKEEDKDKEEDKEEDKENRKEKDNSNELSKKKSPEKAEEKGIYGEFRKVRLTEEDYTKLINRLGKDRALYYISRLDGWLAEGHVKKNHYATILNWWRRDGGAPPPNRKSSNPFLEMMKEEQE